MEEEFADAVFCNLRIELLLVEVGVTESMLELLRERRARVRTLGALLSGGYESVLTS
jgi:hypothetical protein